MWKQSFQIFLATQTITIQSMVHNGVPVLHSIANNKSPKHASGNKTPELANWNSQLVEIHKGVSLVSSFPDPQHALIFTKVSHWISALPTYSVPWFTKASHWCQALQINSMYRAWFMMMAWPRHLALSVDIYICENELHCINWLN